MRDMWRDSSLNKRMEIMSYMNQENHQTSFILLHREILIESLRYLECQSASKTLSSHIVNLDKLLNNEVINVPNLANEISYWKYTADMNAHEYRVCIMLRDFPNNILNWVIRSTAYCEHAEFPIKLEKLFSFFIPNPFEEIIYAPDA